MRLSSPPERGIGWWRDHLFVGKAGKGEGDQLACEDNLLDMPETWNGRGHRQSNGVTLAEILSSG